MKTLYIILFSFLLTKVGNTQNLVATYDVQREVLGVPSGINIPPLSLTGYYYKKGKRIISYLTPDYLKVYPEGSIEIKELNHTIVLFTEPLQMLFSVDLDSQIFRYRRAISESESENYYFYFDKDFRSWEISDKSEFINGFYCKYAVQYNTNRSIIAEIWYSPEFPIMPIGIRNLLNVPGLIVKAKIHGTRETYTLKEFSTSIEPKDEIFWPKVFNERFNKKADLRKVK